MDHRDIIDLFPSVADLARRLDVPHKRVYKWRDRNSIPPEYWIALTKMNRRITLRRLALAVAAK